MRKKAKQPRTPTQTIHHKRLIKQTKQLLTYLSNREGELWPELDDVWPRGMGITGLKAQLKSVNKIVNQPYKVTK